MNLILLGPQGSGKGTQAEMLVKNFGFNYVEMGNLLRSVASSDNRIKETLARGDKVDDELTKQIVQNYISKLDVSRGFVFDGYPRSLVQYGHIKEMLSKLGQKIDRVVYIRISEAEAMRRLSARRMCKKCGNIYNLITNPPPGEGKCECGGELVEREDDKPEAIAKRLKWGYTNDVKEQAEKDGFLTEINGERPIEDIYREMVDRLGLT